MPIFRKLIEGRQIKKIAEESREIQDPEMEEK